MARRSSGPSVGRRRWALTRSTRRSGSGAHRRRHASGGEFAVGHVPGHDQHSAQRRVLRRGPAGCVPYTTRVLAHRRRRDGPASIDRAVRDLALIGLDRIAGFFPESTIDAWTAAGRAVGAIPQITPADLRESLAHGGGTLLDVRGDERVASDSDCGRAAHSARPPRSAAPTKCRAAAGRGAVRRREPVVDCGQPAPRAAAWHRSSICPAASTNGDALGCRSKLIP